ESILSDGLTFIDDREDRLSDKVHAGILEFNTERGFVCSFKESRPKLLMYLDCATDDLLGQLLERNALFNRCCRTSHARLQNLLQIGRHLYRLLSSNPSVS